jgi:single-strand DNA-binding protein
MSSWNINRVIVIGRLTREPELQALPSGLPVCNLRLASNGHRKNAEGTYEEKPNYFDVRVFGARGEAVHRYLGKGSRVAVDGRLEWNEWQSADGSKRQGVKILADTVQFLENGPGRGSGDPSGGDQSEDQDQGEDQGQSEDQDQGEDAKLVGVGSGIEDDVVF